MKPSFAYTLLAVLATLPAHATQAAIKIGLNYPKTGAYAVQGLDQFQAAELAVEEINAAGGIMGEPVEMKSMDDQANAAIGVSNANELIEKDGVKMLFGGVASSVAVAVGKVADAHKVPFFGTLTYATETTGEEGRKYVFRECYDSYAGAKVLGDYLHSHFQGKKFFYVTAHYNWGFSTEKQIRGITGSEDISKNGRVYTPFPGAKHGDFVEAIAAAKKSGADVLVLILFGNDMVEGVKEAQAQGLKGTMSIVVPNLTLGMAEGAGPEAMEGVVGAIPWTAQVPALHNYARGKTFVEKFAAKYHRLPDTSGASAYTILYEYKAAVERAKSTDGPAVVAALEGHEYTALKDKQQWRDFDHQSIQTVYAVRVRKAEEVKKSRFQQDYFEILSSMPGDKAFIPHDEWVAVRTAAKKPPTL